jgi:uncharacterized protein YpmB|tara:strand:- start:1282 stop:1410 length:129 start_codon:yes stop_codon:yes gene_type:complete
MIFKIIGIITVIFIAILFILLYLDTISVKKNNNKLKNRLKDE